MHPDAALSYYKLRGMTRYGWRKQQEERKQDITIDAATDQAQGGEQEQQGNDVHTAAFN